MNALFRILIILVVLFICSGKYFGQKVIIKDIVLDGNKVTKPFVILKEISFQKGDSIPEYNVKELCDRARINIKNLRLFNSVSVTSIPVTNNEIIILIEVIERWYVYPIPIFKLADPNFNTWWLTKDFKRTSYGISYTHKNFRGRNETLRLRAQFGYNRNYHIQYTVPRYNKNRDMDISFLVNFIDYREVTVGTIDNERVFYINENGRDKRHFSVAGSLKLRTTLYDYHQVRLGFNNINISDSLSITFPDHLNNSRTFLEYFDFKYSIGHINVDNQAFPLIGNIWDFSVQLNGLDFSSSENSTADIKFYGSKYWKLSDSWHIQNQLSLKFTAHNTLPYSLQRGLGYRNVNVRGYEYYIVDGQRYILNRNNLLFTLFAPKTMKLPLKSEKFNIFNYAIYLSTFLDIAYVKDELYQDQNFLDNKWLAGTGVGLNFYTIYDRVFRLEYSFNNINEHGLFLHYRKSI